MKTKSCTSHLGQFITLGALVFLLVLFSSQVRAQSAYSWSQEKTDKKEQTKWTLSGWMSQKRKVSLMDQWLVANRNKRKFTFESFIAVDHTMNDVFINEAEAKSGSYVVNRGDLALYMHFLGFEGSIQDSEEGFQDTKTSVNIRLLGSSHQSTNLTIKYGIWNQIIDAEKFDSNFYETELTLYFTNYFGIYGSYSQFLDAESTLSRTQSGQRQEVGAFVDLSSIRLYGNWFQDDFKITETNASVNKYKRDGVVGGIKWFF